MKIAKHVTVKQPFKGPKFFVVGVGKAFGSYGEVDML